ncbi:phospholipid scramblase 3-like [Toxorhynchites rutilus septentrionalis]|uniref:phospholipid scramblase 3-like n=1 Tax=Toxorhynchites rutilus septentrionalis TaxID=329112 RepID=UPI002479CACD|nr:phospholipid scramblase 3-like [Toxorhynchites rutilus septentrionalis]
MSNAKTNQNIHEHDVPTFDLSWDYGYDGEVRVAPQNNVTPIVHQGENRIITAQPQHNENSYISTINDNPIRAINSPFLTPFNPRSGLDFLYGLPSLFIEQTYDLNELLSAVSSENRYTIRGPSNEALYAASETSNSNDRCWGSLRPFQLSLIDRSHHEVLLLKKNLGCGVLCCFCRTQFLEMWATPGDLIGCIQQDFGLTSREIILMNGDLNTMFRITVPLAEAIRMPKETHFRVMDRDLRSQKGTITRAWNVGSSSYTNNIYFNEPELDVRLKALFLGAAFLLVWL